MIFAYVIIFMVMLGMLSFMFFVVLEMWGDIKGAPFVPSGNKDISKLLDVVKIKPGAKVVELGCGSGRFLRAAAQKYQITGWGVDVNWALVMWAKLMSRVSKTRNVCFECRDMYEISLSGADVVYLFLLPRSLQKLDRKLRKEVKKGSVVISHGFELVGWNNQLVTRINNHVFDTFVYQI